MRKPGRNDPCPCGSGKKLKHCESFHPQPEPVQIDDTSTPESRRRKLQNIVAISSIIGGY